VRFLATIWNNRSEHDFVRYSAAHAAVALGVHSIEEEFYSELVTNDTLDRMNIWYHRSYYGDVQASEQRGYGLDDGTGPATRAIQQVLERLNRRQSRHLSLRRVELLTLRRFLERGESVDSSVVQTTCAEIESELTLLMDRDSYADGVRREIAQICSLLR
jgi:hypothetical protein